MRVTNFLKSDRLSHKDPDVRRAAIEALDVQAEGSNLQLQTIALNDEALSVRLLAIAKIGQASVLLVLIGDDKIDKPELHNAIEAKLVQLMGDDQLNESELNSCLSGSVPNAISLLANFSANSAFREKALLKIDEEVQLLGVIKQSKFHDTRLAAANKLTDENLIREAVGACRSRDKVVAKMLQQQLDEKAALEALHKENERSAQEAISSVDQLAASVWSPQTEGKFNALTAKWQSLSAEYTTPHQSQFDQSSTRVQTLLAEHEKQIQATAPEPEPTKDAVANVGKAESEAKPAPEIEPAVVALVTEISTIAMNELPAFVAAKTVEPASLSEKLLSHASAVAVMFDPPYELSKGRPAAIEQRIARVNTLLNTDAIVPGVQLAHCQYMSELTEHAAVLKERLGKAKQESSDRIKATHRQFAALGSTVKEGKWGPASSMFRRLQKKIDAMEPLEKNAFTEKLSRTEKELDDMADWQDFAAKPKLEVLCADMEALAGQELKPEELAKQVKKLQANWKALGVSRAANELWPRFKNAGDTAYEPCKAYFEGKQAERQSKLDAKKALCDALGKEYENTDWETPDWRNLQRLVNNAKRDWSKNRVPDRKPDRALEQRFSDALKPIEDKLAEQYDANAVLKRDLVEKVEKLASSEITQHSVNQARSLQSAWKLVGIMRRKEDQLLWDEFNGHCKVIYKHKHDTEKEKYKASMSHVFRAREIIKTLRAMAKNADIDEAKVQALQVEFQALEEFPEKDKKFLLKDFRSSIDACQKSQDSLSRKRVSAEKEEIQRRVLLCEQIEAGVEVPGSFDDASLEDVTHAWDASEAYIGREVLSLLNARRDQALAHIKAGTQYDYDKNENERRELLIQMEILAEKETPAEDKARRMQYQLASLAEGMTSSSVVDKRAALQESQLKWYSSAPAKQSVKDNLQSRFLNIVSK